MTQERVAGSEPPETPVVANQDPGASAPAEAPAGMPASGTPAATMAQEAAPSAGPLSAPASTTQTSGAAGETPAVAGEPPVPPVTDTAPPSRGGRLPPWLGLIALAVIPALIVGLVVFFAGSSASGGSASGVLDGFIRLGNDPENVISYEGKLPDTFPADFPIYGGSEVMASFSVRDDERNGRSYFAFLGTDDLPSKVYEFYLSRLSSDPWQVEIARASDSFTGVRFSRPDDADVLGEVTIHRSELDKRTTVYITFQDLTPDTPQEPVDIPFTGAVNRPLPPGYPVGDVPIYKGKGGDSVVTETIFQKAPGGSAFIVSFATKDSQADVISFYESEFAKKGWTVTDSENAPDQQFALGIDFSDGNRGTVQGSVTADQHKTNADYTIVELYIQLSSTRGRGN